MGLHRTETMEVGKDSPRDSFLFSVVVRVHAAASKSIRHVEIEAVRVWLRLFAGLLERKA